MKRLLLSGSTTIFTILSATTLWEFVYGVQNATGSNKGIKIKMIKLKIPVNKTELSC